MRYRAEVADRPDALYALWNGQIFRAQRSTADETVLLAAPEGAEPPDDFDAQWQGAPAKVVPAAEARATFSIHTYCLFDDEAYRVEPRSQDGELTLRWAGRDERLAADLGLVDFTATTDDPETLTALWQERHDFAEEGTPRTEPGSGDTQALLRAIGRTLLSFLPSGWHRVGAQFRQVGDYSELEVRAVAGDVAVSLSAPAELSQLFAQLRSAMYEPDKGTWFQGTFTLDASADFDFDYDTDTEPDWRLPPEGRTTARSYDVEFDYYPRTNAPVWLSAKAGRPLEVTFRGAKVVDSHVEGEKPVVNRPPVPQEEIPRILNYLYRAPVVAGRPGLLQDIFVQGPPNVPDAVHTDGTWIWPAAVPHYLRKYGVPPEADLLDHIRACDYRPDYVESLLRRTAEADVVGKPRPARSDEDLEERDVLTELERGREPKRDLRAGEVLTVLRRRLAEHGVDDGAWSLRRTERGWEVASPTAGEPRCFTRVRDAAEALLGAVLLAPGKPDSETTSDAEAQKQEDTTTDWPIVPLRGEPPLHFYRRKRMIVLPEDSIVRRFGNETGNLVHPEGTAFAETSLAFERETEIHHYRVARPLHVLTGVTSPWGPLRGGAVGYLLPHAIGKHIESGALERVPPKN
ncbi:hypothetical protein BAY61_31610 [Prauserella marina]|uniref:Uncharacterized protein n=1 Tax=Prauserella marina TaxID=530584 RepID=A0A222VXU0_9PSEU|nr:TNT domain-containing protein [Prauserella marina]ASR38796.1 hypothetical protein BAY61_31610 [Prauserella marina]PWV82157.1 uncharacterized protein DUF4237 [Prauserella marina]SDD20537.1 Protein of unknown function [Prauserella marina]